MLKVQVGECLNGISEKEKLHSKPTYTLPVIDFTDLTWNSKQSYAGDAQGYATWYSLMSTRQH